MTIVFVGIDLAKTAFAVHGVNTACRAEMVRPNVPHAKLHELIAALPACTIGMEACSRAHHWAKRLQALGHTVKLIHSMLTKGEEYSDQGQAYYEERFRQQVLHNLNRRAQQLGMMLVPTAPAAQAT